MKNYSVRGVCASQNAKDNQALRRRQRRLREGFQRGPVKTTNRTGQKLGIPQSTLWRFIGKCLRVKPYRLQLLQALTHDDKTRFCCYAEMEHHLPPVSLNSWFSATKLPSWEGAHKVRIWGTENPHAANRHIRHSPKLNVTSKMRLHHLARDYLNQHLSQAGSDARPQKTRRYLAGHQGVLRTLFLRRTQRICRSCQDESSLPSQKSIVTCCSGYGRKWIVGLTSAVSQRADTQSIYEVWKAGGRGEVSLSICRSCVTILSANEVYRFYAMCQGSMNNPALKYKRRYNSFVFRVVSVISVKVISHTKYKCNNKHS